MLRNTRELSFASSLCLVFLCLVTLSGCRSNPNVDLCLFWNDPTKPDEKPEIFCDNMRTGNQKTLTLQEAHKFYMMSSKDYEIVRAWYKSGCNE